MVTDVLRKDRYFGVVQVFSRFGLFQLRDEIFRSGMLDLCLVEKIFPVFAQRLA